jgi:hypothetical protein
MNSKDLRSEIRRLAPPNIKNSWEMKSEIKQFQESIKSIRDKDITAVAKIIIEGAISRRSSDEPIMYENDFITNDMIIDLIEPLVTQVRLDIFNSPNATFENLVDAGEWLYAESAKPIPKDKKEKANKFQEFVDLYHSSILKNELWSCGSTFVYTNETITFPGIKEENAGWTEAVAVGWSENLKRLYTGIHKILNITDFPEYAITAHILTGIKPIQPKYSIKTPFYYSAITRENWYKRNQVVITINAADLTFEDLKKIYKKYRKRLNFTRKKSITSKQVRIIRMINQAGDVPDFGVTAFWREMFDKWNSEYPDEAYKNWEGIYRAYNRLKDKMMPGETDNEDIWRNMFS